MKLATERDLLVTPPAPPEMMPISPKVDHHNGLIFIVSYLLIYFAAPVVYVGVVQAALCNKLGANAALANLPASAYLFGAFAPILLSCVIPCRLERAVVVWSNGITSILLTMVCATLLFPLASSIRITALVGQGLIQGFTSSTSQVFMLQCLARGTTPEGRTRTLKWAFGFGPIAAVVGSLGAQFILNAGLPFLPYPYDFAFLYCISIPCMAGVALICTRYRLIPVKDEERSTVSRHLVDCVKTYFTVRPLLLLWVAYALWYTTLSAMPNLSLYTHQAMGRDPKELSGLVLALRFGFKSAGGFLLGMITMRWGIRAPVATTVLLLGMGIAWAWVAPGYSYLLAFGLMGAGELGGTYFPNYVVASSSAQAGARNLSVLTLATPMASLTPTLHGGLTDLFGFPASFALGITTAGLALWLVLKLPLLPKAAAVD